MFTPTRVKEHSSTEEQILSFKMRSHLLARRSGPLVWQPQCETASTETSQATPWIPTPGSSLLTHEKETTVPLAQGLQDGGFNVTEHM